MWKKERLKTNESGKIEKKTLVTASGREWRALTAQLQDLQITIYEVDETFPTMYFMQKIIKKKITSIYGVEKEILTWNQRIRKHQKIRRLVSQKYALTQRPNDYIEVEIQEFYANVGPFLQTFWDEIRTDVDSD